jgi:ferredoxin
VKILPSICMPLTLHFHYEARQNKYMDLIEKQVVFSASCKCKILHAIEKMNVRMVCSCRGRFGCGLLRLSALPDHLEAPAAQIGEPGQQVQPQGSREPP